MIFRKLAVLPFLLLLGAATWPLETRIDAASKTAGLRTAAVDLGMRERVGQTGFLAALSGFRSPLAAFLWIEAMTAWENTEWGRMAGIFDTVTLLQPRAPLYWDLSAWHMGYNAATAALQNEKQPSEALRIRSQRQYQQMGRDYLERGIRNNPENRQLHIALGSLLRDKMEDHPAAAAAFLAASKLPDAPPYVKRAAALELAKCPGREREAYGFLKSLYDEGPPQRVPGLVHSLRELEKKLDIPAGKRIDSSTP